MGDVGPVTGIRAPSTKGFVDALEVAIERATRTPRLRWRCWRQLRRDEREFGALQRAHWKAERHNSGWPAGAQMYGRLPTRWRQSR